MHSQIIFLDLEELFRLDHKFLNGLIQLLAESAYNLTQRDCGSIGEIMARKTSEMIKANDQ